MSSFRQMNGGQALAEMLKMHDPAPMFGMAGFQLLPFYDAVREQGFNIHLSTTSAPVCSPLTHGRGLPVAPVSAMPRSVQEPQT